MAKKKDKPTKAGDEIKSDSESKDSADEPLERLLESLGQARPKAAGPDGGPNEMVRTNARVAPAQQIKQTMGPRDRYDRSSDSDPLLGRLQGTVRKVLDDLDGVGDEILDKWRGDRRQQQEVIDILLGVVRNSQTPGDIPRIYLETLVQALGTMADMNLTAVKLLDTRTKLIAATRSQVLINNNVNTENHSSDLEEILSQPLENDLDD